MMRLARHEVLVLCDSDTRVDSSYLREVVAPLEDSSIGLVTCLFAGVPQDDALTSKLIAMFMNDQFIPSPCVEGLFGPLRHGFGPTNAMRAEVLREIGGFEALGEHLADDFVLGTSRRSDCASSSRSTSCAPPVSEPNLPALFRHELRWHRTIRGVEPAGYAGMFVTYPIVLALFGLLFARNRTRAAALLVVAAAARISLQRVSARALGVKPAGAWLVLPRGGLFSFAVQPSGRGRFGAVARFAIADRYRRRARAGRARQAAGVAGGISFSRRWRPRAESSRVNRGSDVRGRRGAGR